MDYVAEVLRDDGYRIETPSTAVPTFLQTAPSVLERVEPAPATWVDGRDLRAMLFSASGDVEAPIAAVDGGCSPGDFSGFPDGAIALVEPGPCFRRDQVGNAQAAGAAAFIGVTTAETGRPLRPTLITPDGIDVPAVAVTAETGAELADGDLVHVSVSATSGSAQARSVVASPPGAGERGRRDARRASGLGHRRAGDRRQRIRRRAAPRGRALDRRERPGRAGPVRLLGRGGGGAVRIARLRERPRRGRARRHPRVPEPRHGGVAELRDLRLRPRTGRPARERARRGPLRAGPRAGEGSSPSASTSRAPRITRPSRRRASRPAACTRARTRSRPPSRPTPTAGRRARRSTRATTRRATRSRT